MEKKKNPKPRTVSRELQRIQEMDPTGILHAERVVEEAEDRKNPLHPFFEWKDSAAAHQFRLEQARGLIRRYAFVEVEGDKPVRQFFALRVDRINGGGYRSIRAIFENPANTKALLVQALADAISFRSKYDHLFRVKRITGFRHGEKQLRRAIKKTQRRAK